MYHRFVDICNEPSPIKVQAITCRKEDEPGPTMKNIHIPIPECFTQIRPVDPSTLVSPIIEGMTIRCLVERNRTPLSVSSETITLLEEGTNCFLLSACKFSSLTGARFCITFNSSPKASGEDAPAGEMKANKKLRQFTYTPNELHEPTILMQYTGAARILSVPRMFTIKVHEYRTRQTSTRLEQMKPSLSHGRYYLKFDGRAQQSSVKNFIVCAAGSNEKVLLFGKIDANHYVADMRYPLSVAEGFALCCASLNNGSFQY